MAAVTPPKNVFSMSFLKDNMTVSRYIFIVVSIIFIFVLFILILLWRGKQVDHNAAITFRSACMSTMWWTVVVVTLSAAGASVFFSQLNDTNNFHIAYFAFFVSALSMFIIAISHGLHAFKGHITQRGASKVASFWCYNAVVMLIMSLMVTLSDTNVAGKVGTLTQSATLVPVIAIGTFAAIDQAYKSV